MKNWSKPLVKIALLLALTAGTQSCLDRLDIDPKSAYGVDNYYQTVSEINTAILGIYSDLGSGSLYGSNYFPIVGDNDESHFGTRAGDDGDISRYTVSTVNTMLTGYITTLYNGVQRANLCIEKIPQMQLYANGTASEKNSLRRYYGEALALRALFYFDLVRLFGDVPFVTKYASMSENNNLPRTSRDTIYDRIIADLDTAIAYLPWQETLGNYECERITKNAAYGFLSRICFSAAGYSLRWDLNGGDNAPCAMALRADSATRVPQLYQIARDRCKAVMEHGYNNLNSSYTQVFKNYCQDLYYPQESMSEIAFYYLAGSSSYAGRVGTANCYSINGSSKYKAGNNYLKCLATYYLSFDSNDTRKKQAGIYDAVLATNYRQCQTLSEIGIAKWRRDWCLSGTQTDNNSTGINWVLLRYSDVLLMFAEAENKLNNGPTSDAINAYETVRKRAFGVAPYGSNPASLIGTTPGDYQGFFDALVNERSWELGHEGWRKQDLIRWNLLATKIAATQNELLLLATVQGKYSTQPVKMYYKYNTVADTIAYSSVDFGKAASPYTSGSANWISDVNPNYGKSGYVAPTDISQLTKYNYFAQGFVHNRSEILPIPKTLIDSDPALKQCPAYNGL